MAKQVVLAIGLAVLGALGGVLVARSIYRDRGGMEQNRGNEVPALVLEESAKHENEALIEIARKTIRREKAIAEAFQAVQDGRRKVEVMPDVPRTYPQRLPPGKTVKDSPFWEYVRFPVDSEDGVYITKRNPDGTFDKEEIWRLYP